MGSLFGGSKQQKTTTTNTVAPYVKEAGQNAVNIADKLAAQPYTPYSGQRVADTSPMMDLAYQKTLDGQGQYQGNIDRASAGVGAAYDLNSQIVGYTDPNRSYSAMGWDTDQMNKYMNPYIEGALEPAARSLREEYDITVNRDNASAASQGALGGSRAAVLEGVRENNTMQGMSDLYAGGYKDAYDSALGAFNLDADRSLDTSRFNESIRAGELDRLGGVSNELRSLGAADLSIANTGATLAGDNIQQLFTAGAIDQTQNQKQLDQGYMDFVEERDWLSRGLGYYNQVLGTVPQESGQTQTTSGGGSSTISQIAGLATAIGGIPGLFGN